jgi:hypothetical protein
VTRSRLAEARRELALQTKGFMPADEGDALWDAAVSAAGVVPDAPFLEVGSYCGRSTVWLGDAAERTGRVLFAVDHHRGSEENQAGWEHHDTEVIDQRSGKMDTLPFFRSAIHDADLEASVIAVGESRLARTSRGGRRTSRLAGPSPSTTCSPIRLMAADRRTRRSTSRRSSRETSSRHR